jgi:uncharacterized membrane-anchored protein YitT (DUF2179 family)
MAKEKKKFFSKENWTKEKVNKGIKKYLVLTIANLILSLAIVLFLNPLTIVSGGLSGLAITIDTLIPGQWLDIILYIGEGILIIFSFIFLGKKTTFKSLYSCIVCPLFTTLFTRVIPLYEAVNLLYGFDPATGLYTLAQDTSLLLLGALIGGIGTGTAVGLAFMVGGSTAGVDTIVLIIKKYCPRLKESVMCFAIDSGIIIVGTVVSLISVKEFSSYSIVIIFINIMTAVITAGTLEAIYMMRNASVTINVISDKWEEIRNYIIKDLDRGCTLYDVQGGYEFAPRKELKTVVSKKQSEKTKEEILKIDPNCFLTLTVSKGVFGEGFQARFSDE